MRRMNKKGHHEIGFAPYALFVSIMGFIVYTIKMIVGNVKKMFDKRYT